MIDRLRSDDRGMSKLEITGLVLVAIIVLSMIPQFRELLDIAYENLVGKNNVGPGGEPQPGVLMRGIIVGIGSLLVFVGSVFLLNYTNLGQKLAFLLTGASFFGFLAVVGMLYTMYAPRGLRPADIEGLNAFQLKILPAALMLGSLILFGMFLAALNRYESELVDE